MIIDTLIQSVALTVLLVAGLAAGALIGFASGRFAEWIVLVALALGGFVVTAGYYLVFEIIWNGQTPGKRAVGIRVIRENGYPVRPVDSVIRNVVRIADWVPIFYGIGVLVMLFNKRSRRLGDFAAGTIVVREGARRTLTNVASVAASDETPVASVVLSSADATLVRDFLVRRASIDPAARADLARRLADVLARRYHLPAGDDPEVFLERVSG